MKKLAIVFIVMYSSTMQCMKRSNVQEQFGLSGPSGSPRSSLEPDVNDALESLRKKPKVSTLEESHLDDLQPPECFRITPQDVPPPAVESPLVGNGSPFDEGSIDWSCLSWGNLGDFFDDALVVPPPPLPPLYYLTVYDFNIKDVRTFSANSKPELLKAFMICYIHNANTQDSRDAQAHLHRKVPFMPIKEQGSEYAIECSVGSGLCRSTEVAPSKELLIVQLFAHFVVTHCKDSDWYKNISAYIGESPQEAMKKMQELK